MRRLHPQVDRGGLEQAFNSLDAQREAGEACVRSQAGEGWALSAERYDSGYTGANTDRPELRKLLDHIAEGRVDCVVVHKAGRLSCSLLDFAQLMRTAGGSVAAAGTRPEPALTVPAPAVYTYDEALKVAEERTKELMRSSRTRRERRCPCSPARRRSCRAPGSSRTA